MEASFIWLSVVQLGLIIILALLLYILLKQSFYSNIERRFGDYSLTSFEDE